MNTCAECRFWKDIAADGRAFYGAIATKTPSGEFKECRRVREDYNGAFIVAQGSDDEALMTRSDFGCVQFEAALLSCDCGCGKLTPGGHMEGAHPEDYKYDERA